MDFIGLEDGGRSSLGPVTSGDSSIVASEIFNNNTSYVIERYTDVTVACSMECGSL